MKASVACEMELSMGLKATTKPAARAAKSFSLEARCIRPLVRSTSGTTCHG
jgi:hypothetical protein